MTEIEFVEQGQVVLIQCSTIYSALPGSDYGAGVNGGGSVVRGIRPWSVPTDLETGDTPSMDVRHRADPE